MLQQDTHRGTFAAETKLYPERQEQHEQELLQERQGWSQEDEVLLAWEAWHCR